MSTKTSRSRTTGFMVGETIMTTSTPARQSSRVAVNEHSDNAVWQEKLVVCEGTNRTDEPVLLVRSYYRNLETMEKIWDEPPSGAGAVVHATPEERSQAEEKRTQLELTLQMIPEDTVDVADLDQYHGGAGAAASAAKDDNSGPPTEYYTATASSNTPGGNNKGFFRRFRKTGRGGTSSSSSKERKQRQRDHVNAAKDINLQKAIARSIQEQSGGIDDVELAMALSLSVETNNRHDDEYDDEANTQAAVALSSSTPRHTTHEPTEEELFQRALERSQREKPRDSSKDNNDDDEDELLRLALERSKQDQVVRAPAVASLPKHYGEYDDSSSLAMDHDPGATKEHLSEDEMELKMPAKPKPKFDPYG